MAKKYSEQLGRWLKESQSTKRDQHVAAFLAVRRDVEAALADGYSGMAVWKNLHAQKRVEFCYNTFMNYVNRHIRSSKTPGDSVKAPQFPRPSARSPKKQHTPVAPTSETLAGFTFNATPRKEDLF